MPVIEEKDGQLVIQGRPLSPEAALYGGQEVIRAARHANAGHKVRLARWRVGDEELVPSAAVLYGRELVMRACGIIAEQMAAKEAAVPVPAEVGGEAGSA